MTTRVYLSLGSNIERQQHISAGLKDLQAHFGTLDISSIYESEAVGFDGDAFYNLVVGLDTEMPLTALYHQLKAIEDTHGRKRDGVKFSARTLDIDILTYGDYIGDFAGGALPRDEITKNAFVLWPLAELCPEQRHPQLGQTYQQLWQAYDRDQHLWRVPFIWQGRQLSTLAEA